MWPLSYESLPTVSGGRFTHNVTLKVQRVEITL
jgi:hypothetical protein